MTHGHAENSQALDRAADALRAGGLAVFPTDTVYGVGVAALHAQSPHAIFEAKGRDAAKPIAWLVGGPDALDDYGLDVPAQARQLARAHWPGALTIIVRASAEVPSAFQSAEGTIGLRMPDSPEALALVRAVGPIAASSANLSGCPAPYRFEDVAPALLRHAGAFVRSHGVGASGVASTVIDCSTGSLRVVREGDIAVAQTAS